MMKGVEIGYGYCLMEDGLVYNIKKWKPGDAKPRALKWVKKDKTNPKSGYKVGLSDKGKLARHFTHDDARRIWKLTFEEELIFPWEKEGKEEWLEMNMKRSNTGKKIYCKELDRVFESQAAAARELGLDKCSISKVCLGKQHTTGGFHFEFVEEKEGE